MTASSTRKSVAEPIPIPEGLAPRVRARRAIVVGARLLAGVSGVAVAALAIGVVGLVPFPSYHVAVPAVEVIPAPAEQIRVCPGGMLRLGEESGADTGTPVPIDEATVVAFGFGAALRLEPLEQGDAGTGGSSAAPVVLRIAPESSGPGDGVTLAGAQSQTVAARDFVGLAAAVCAEPRTSIWLVSGAMTVGRSAVLTLSNPTAVAATVDLAIYGENGPVVAPGLSGINVPAGFQRVLALAGFAPGLAFPVVHVEARGGQVVAAIQQSIVRGLAASGVELTGVSPEPSTDFVIPGVRILDSVGTNRALALGGWEDVGPAIRILAPGEEPARVQVNIVPDDPTAPGASFELTVDGGTVSEVPLDSGATATGHGFEDGTYTVVVSSDVPVVAAVRVSTAVDTGVDPEPDAVLDPPASDFAWFVAAVPLDGDTLMTAAPGPDPILSARNTTGSDITIWLDAQGGADLELLVPAGASASIPIDPGVSYLLRGAAGLAVAVSLAGPGELAGYVIWPSLPVAGPIVIHPN
jgi:hypothetical protein